MGRDRSARVSAVGRSENLALGALQGAAVTRGLASDAQIIVRLRVRGTRPWWSYPQFFAPHARYLQVCGCLRDGASSPLRLLLQCLDCGTGLLVVDPSGAIALLEDPPSTGLNPKAQFGIGVGDGQFSVDLLALLFQAFDLLCDLHPPEQHGISAQFRKMRETVCLEGNGCQYFSNGFHGSRIPDA